MKLLFRITLLFIPIAVYLSSCQKESSFDGAGNGNGGNGNGNGGSGNNNNCNNTVMKLKKWQATFKTDYYTEAGWNTDGTIKSIKMNVPLSEYRTASYLYANGKIKEAVLYENFNNQVEDTVIFRYNAEGKVDSMYRKNENGFNIKLSYSNGKLVKYSRYIADEEIFYWNITTDANDNIIKADEYMGNGSTFNKTSTYTFTRDNRKNPFSGIAQYMMYLDEPFDIFRYWGPNNYTEQRYQDYTIGLDLTTGYKFKYNDNCYPGTSQNTISGQILFTDDDFTFSYY